MKSSVSAFYYDEVSFSETSSESVEDCLSHRPAGSTGWINVDGLDPDTVRDLGSYLGIHQLLVEDIGNTAQRPKMEESDGYVFLILKMLTIHEGTLEVEEEQVSLALTRDTVATFQERKGDVFDSVRERLRNGKGLIRRMGPDYLAYLLIDAVVDNYFEIMERLGDRIEGLEEELIENPAGGTLKELHHVRRQMITLRRSVWPLRGVMDMLERCGNEVISDAMRIYYRDVYDHTVQLIDAIETNRDLVSSILDVYLTSLNNKLNEVMKFLTIVGTIFIPLSFIASVYGMNFRYMPELDAWWGYPLVWVVMITVGVTMMLYFRRKGWV